MAYINTQHPQFSKLSKKLGLADNSAFSALVTDIYVNTSVETDKKQVNCLLLDRFVSLLCQLAGESPDQNKSAHQLS